MNVSDFENELRALHPVAPSPTLEDRIATGIARSAGRSQAALDLDSDRPPGTLAFRGLHEWLQRLGWALAGAAAAIAGVLFFQSDARELPSPLPEIAAVEAKDFVPSESESELVEAGETGIIYTEDAEPFRQMRFRSVERYAWTNPETGARVEVEVPREDVVLMPVAMQ